MDKARNVLGNPLETCCESPLTGFYRDGCCNTGEDDPGVHVVCAELTEEFLEFSAAHGNDLRRPSPAMGFPGLKPGDCWCLCAARWQQAFEAGVAPPVVLAATHIAALRTIELGDLLSHAVASEVN